VYFNISPSLTFHECSILPMMSLEFLIDIILPAALWLWGYSASNRNEYKEYFLGVKAAGAQG